LSQSVITRKGQITIPKVIREHLKAKEGEKVAFILRGDEVVLKVLHGTILDLKGTVKASQRPEDFARIRDSVKKAVSSRVARRD
jgi:antitoxin PrlF